MLFAICYLLTLQIGLHQEYIARIGSFYISNSFFTTILVSLLIVLASIFLSRTLTGVFGRGRLQRLGEIIYEPIWKFIRTVLENDKAAEFVFPYIATFFVFILISNFVEILPGFLGSFGIRHEHGELIPLLRSPSTDLNVTLALALVSVGITQLIAVRFLGFKKYISKFINFRSPLKAFLGFFEAVGEISKVLSFSFRLFGNMFAGSVLLIVIGFLVPYIIPLPFMFLELFVGLVQALIFSMLTLMFIKAALTH
ncbi:MAG: F0F1 ATP synthase subunit A [bacterium]|nr:F0F1 ATP synthase subunit A [bacterium]